MTTGFYLTICIVLAISSGIISQPDTSSSHRTWINEKHGWNFKKLCKAELEKVESQVHVDRIRNYLLPAMMEVRPPGSNGSLKVRNFIRNILNKILRWNLEYDSFVGTPPLPHAPTRFTNVIVTHNPNAKRRLVLACHYDSKITPKDFRGAIDSAVPCSMMIEIAIALRSFLTTTNDVTLELIFFDGEEAFVKWSNSDSLYGSRHLAHKWHRTPWPPLAVTNYNRLDSIDLLFLMDLLGAPNPRFYNSLMVPSTHFNKLTRIEKLLYGNNEYFQSSWNISYVQDDHLPFYQRGVPILHVISSPFPPQWHTLQDHVNNLDFDSIEKLTRIFAVFVAEYLHLDLGVSPLECAGDVPNTLAK